MDLLKHVFKCPPIPPMPPLPKLGLGPRLLGLAEDYERTAQMLWDGSHQTLYFFGCRDGLVVGFGLGMGISTVLFVLFLIARRMLTPCAQPARSES